MLIDKGSFYSQRRIVLRASHIKVSIQRSAFTYQFHYLERRNWHLRNFKELKVTVRATACFIYSKAVCVAFRKMS